MKPLASFAISAILSSEVGAIMEMRSMPYFSAGPWNSSFSSKGTSGRISPSIPAAAALSMNRSVP